MAGARPGSRAARLKVARRVAALAVLAGLLMLPCADGMMMTAPGAMPAMPAGCAQPATLAVEDAALACAAPEMPGSGEMGGVVAACLMLLVVVVAAVGLRPSARRVLAQTRARVSLSVPGFAGVRAPSLAKLCLLRT